MKGKKNSLFQTGKMERTSYWLYFVGLNIFYGLIYVNIQTFYSDVGISAAAIAVIMLITKVWDAINDPLFGVIVDRVYFKKGRYSTG